MSESDHYFMGEALSEAQRALANDEVPIGAVVVIEGQIIGRGWNQKETRRTPTAHAEMIAIEEATRFCQNWCLHGTTLYSTLEPCAMCAGALVLARVDRLVFALRDAKSGACGSVVNIVANEHFNHRLVVCEGVRQAESLDLLQQFFRQKRQLQAARKRAAK